LTNQHITRGRALKFAAARVRDRAERGRLFADAAQAYAAGAEGTRSTYALINAATLYRLAGAIGPASDHAAAVLAMLDSRAHDPDTPYWLAVTRAEALLVLGDAAGAEQALDQAFVLAPRAWEEHAITLRQFRLLLAETARSGAWLDRFRVPPVMVFGGTMGLAPDDEVAREAIARAVAGIAPCEAYGALAAGADILAAEAALGGDVELHVLLPCRAGEFRARSVEVVDPAWGPRFDACREWASAIEVVAEGAGEDAALAAFAAELAMGQAIARAQALETRAIALLVTAGPGGNRAIAALWERWERHGLELRRIELARTGEAPRRGEGDVAPLALLASDSGAVREFPSLGDALAAVAAQPGERFGLDYGFTGQHRVPSHALASALLAAGAEGGIRASAAAAFAARLVDPRIEGELAGGVNYEGGMADFHRLHLPAD
jgi:hypothetical protein